MTIPTLNEAQVEILVSFLISQGQTRVRAYELVKQDAAAVQAEMDRVASSAPAH